MARNSENQNLHNNLNDRDWNNYKDWDEYRIYHPENNIPLKQNLGCEANLEECNDEGIISSTKKNLQGLEK
jgi:hypothetical protein